MPYSGSVFVVFKSPVAAFEFCELVTHRFATTFSTISVRLAGPDTEIVVGNLAKNKFILKFVFAMSMLLFIVLLFFWSVPVAFFGSLDSLATVPVVGQVFQAFSDRVSVTIRGILQAYLPRPRPGSLQTLFSLF